MVRVLTVDLRCVRRLTLAEQKPSRFVACRLTSRARCHFPAPPNSAREPFDHIGGQENEDGAERNGYLYGEPRLRRFRRNTIHRPFSIRTRRDRIFGGGQGPVPDPDAPAARHRSGMSLGERSPSVRVSPARPRRNPLALSDNALVACHCWMAWPLREGPTRRGSI